MSDATLQKTSSQETNELLLNELLLAVLQAVKTFNTRVGHLEESYHTLDKKMEVELTALKGDIKRVEETYTTKAD